MTSSDIFANLPHEFAPPRHAAAHIAGLSTLAARNAYFDRIPAVWQEMVRHMAILQIAGEIVAIDGIDGRREALTRVPFEWRRELESHLLRLWRRRVAVAAQQGAGA